VYQRLVGCELLNNGKPGPLHFWGAFDGQYMEEFTYDLNNIHVEKPWITSWDQLKRLNLKLLYENIYHPICIKVLLRYLHLEKNHVMRKGERINLINFSIIKIKKYKCIINKYDPDSSTDRKCVEHQNHK